MRFSASLSTVCVAALSLVVSACSTANPLVRSLDTRQNAGACPPSGSIYNASRLVDLDGEGVRFSNIAYTGEIVDVRLFCRYAGTDPVRIELEVDFAFGQGPAATADTRDYTYWVAVTRRSGKVLAKEFFTVRGDFSDGPVDAASELLQGITIPRAEESVSAANFEVLVGFDLTEEQLAFNKEGQRFRLNAAAGQ
ncbi:MAG: hypothetical protein AAGF20_11345 [Pseudomonadota bacterium]